MEKPIFIKLCDILRNYGLTSTKCDGLEEGVGMFLMTLGHSVGNRIIQEQFQHSGETTSRQFGIVLKKMIMLHFDEIRPFEEYNEVSHYIRSNHKYWSYFKDCIEAIDGTHVRVSLLVDEQIPYIERKGSPTQNSMAVCGFDMLFTFVCLGWEGTAHDARIFLEAIRNTELKLPKPPDGQTTNNRTINKTQTSHKNRAMQRRQIEPKQGTLAKNQQKEKRQRQKKEKNTIKSPKVPPLNKVTTTIRIVLRKTIIVNT
ncbi:hypothetical protein Ddye_021286 [Dipteronia dyeriana]|uniref:DUF8040 domain-containing protein n=1 Tax=Dipteronia dyeriana TaxID=168575 RepID=A0AAD9U1D8_9ROSI|nr:hypothetical protein Ddye_021286 [Dipteronia dyeriana]